MSRRSPPIPYEIFLTSPLTMILLFIAVLSFALPAFDVLRARMKARRVASHPTL